MHLYLQSLLLPNLTFPLVSVLHLNIFQMYNTNYSVSSFLGHPCLTVAYLKVSILRRDHGEFIPSFSIGMKLSAGLIVVRRLASLFPVCLIFKKSLEFLIYEASCLSNIKCCWEKFDQSDISSFLFLMYNPSPFVFWACCRVMCLFFFSVIIQY